MLALPNARREGAWTAGVLFKEWQVRVVGPMHPESNKRKPNMRVPSNRIGTAVGSGQDIKLAGIYLIYFFDV